MPYSLIFIITYLVCEIKWFKKVLETKLKILCLESRMLVPPNESDQNNVPDPGLRTATTRKSDLLLIISVSINGYQGF